MVAVEDDEGCDRHVNDVARWMERESPEGGDDRNGLVVFGDLVAAKERLGGFHQIRDTMKQTTSTTLRATAILAAILPSRSPNSEKTAHQTPRSASTQT